MNVPVTLDTWDYVSVSVITGLSALVAFYHVFTVKSTKSTREFLVSGKDLGFLPILLSSVATAISPSSLQGYPLEIYLYGIQFIFLSFAQFVGITFFAYVFLPVYYNLQVSSIFQYLEYRFNRAVGLMASIVNTAQAVLYTSCLIYAPALALNQVTGLHLWGSVMSIGLTCIIYTALGGIKAVIWSDVIQLIVIICAMFVVMIKGCTDVGGVMQIWNRAVEGKRLNIYIYPNTPNIKETIWTYLIGGSFYGLAGLTANQMFIQRFLANPNLTRARCCLYLTAFCAKGLTIFFAIIGLVMYAKYWDCDPYLNGVVKSRDQLVPLFAVETLSFVKGFPGIFVAGVLCATLSTLSSILNALSTITLTDYIRPLRPDMSDYAAMRLSKLLVIVYGIVCIAFVALAANMGGLVRAVFSIAGAVGGPLLAVFSLGILFPWVNSQGALSGFGASLLLGLWVTTGSLLSKTRHPTAPVSTIGCSKTVDSLLANFTTPSSNFSATISTGAAVDLLNTTASVNSGPSAVLAFPPQSDFFLYTLSPLWYTALTALTAIIVGITISILTGTQDPEEVDPRLISPVMEKFYRSFPEKIRLLLGYKSKKMKKRENNPTSSEKYQYSSSVAQEDILEMKMPLNSNGKCM